MPERPEPPAQASEEATLTGFLDFLRATVAWRVEGLSAEQLRQRLEPSALTLIGIVKHLAWVEEYWFSYVLWGKAPSPVWRAVDWEAEPDWEFTSALVDDPAEVMALWRTTTDSSRQSVSEAGGDLGLVAVTDDRFDEAPSLRWILTHMIEEYARHCGHMDLIRESIDGQVGE